jgi:hypothetical protein
VHRWACGLQVPACARKNPALKEGGSSCGTPKRELIQLQRAAVERIFYQPSESQWDLKASVSKREPMEGANGNTSLWQGSMQPPAVLMIGRPAVLQNVPVRLSMEPYLSINKRVEPAMSPVSDLR